MKNVLVILAVLLSFMSCERTDEDIPDLGYDYYPLSDSSYVMYQVVEYIYDEFQGTRDSNGYQLLELVDTAYTDLSGRTIHNLVRFTRASDTVDWKLKDVWTVYKGDDRLERMEENVTFVRLSFPLKRGKTWDGNSRNDSSEQIYTVLDYNLKNKVDGTTFKNTARINHFENINLIEDQFQEEIYARDVGLVQRIDRNLELDPADGSPKAGYDITWTYIEHGKL